MPPPLCDPIARAGAVPGARPGSPRVCVSRESCGASDAQPQRAGPSQHTRGAASRAAQREAAPEAWRNQYTPAPSSAAAHLGNAPEAIDLVPQSVRLRLRPRCARGRVCQRGLQASPRALGCGFCAAELRLSRCHLRGLARVGPGWTPRWTAASVQRHCSGLRGPRQVRRCGCGALRRAQLLQRLLLHAARHLPAALPAAQSPHLRARRGRQASAEAADLRLRADRRTDGQTVRAVASRARVSRSASAFRTALRIAPSRASCVSGSAPSPPAGSEAPTA